MPVIASAELSAASQFALLDESLFPARDVAMLARRIDWWIDHPHELAVWGGRYAEHAKADYSVEASVAKFVAMEREAIAARRPRPGVGLAAVHSNAMSWSTCSSVVAQLVHRRITVCSLSAFSMKPMRTWACSRSMVGWSKVTKTWFVGASKVSV